MGISIEAYRITIGTFCAAVKYKTLIKLPKSCFFNNGKGYMFYGQSEWTHMMFARRVNKHVITSKSLLIQVLGCSVFIHLLLLILSNDVHPNPGPSFKKYISICHANVRSLKSGNRMLFIKSDLAGKFDIITLSETWLCGDDKNENFSIPGYQLPYRRDRHFGGAHGGVMAYVSDNIACKRRKDLESNDMELLWLQVNALNQSLFLCVIYRTDSNSDNTFWDKLQDNIDNVRELYNPKILLCGDLNADFNTREGKSLLEFVEGNNLTYHITTPTRITSTSATILDQFITNFPIFKKDIDIFPPLPNCDHSIISANCFFKFQNPKPYKRIMWNFKEADFDAYRRKLNEYDWNSCFESNNIDVICDKLTDNIIAAAKQTIPNKLVSVRPHDQPWYSNTLRCKKRSMLRSYRKFKNTGNSEDFNTFRKKRSDYSNSVILAKENYDKSKFSSLAQDKAENPKKWWSLIKSVYNNCPSQNSIPPIENDDLIITDDKEKAEAFNKFFIQASHLDDSEAKLPDDNPVFNHDNGLSHINITQQDIIDQIKNLDISKSYGPDGISPVFIKEGGNVLHTVLLRFYSLSIELGKFPASFKKADVVPIHKKDLKTLVKNYRPISLLSTLSKIFEKIVFKYVYNYFRDNFILSIYQSGFQPGMSTVTQLIEVYHKFCEAVDKGKEIRVVFLDIQKAFDKVWHRGLIHKLNKCGINGNLLSWFEDYLKDRKQRVLINGQSSSWRNLNAGVPQGSVLGPLLFLIFINDISHVINYCNIRLFADDTCLFIDIDNASTPDQKALNRNQAAKSLEDDLSSIQQWSSKWLVTFSPPKTKSLVISNKPDSSLNPPLHFNGYEVEDVKHHKYLGLSFSHNLKWSDHINDISTKARKRLSLMIPLKFKLDRLSLETMYNSFVLPTMEYGNIVWGGTFETDLNKLNKIHIDAMRLVSGATARCNIDKLLTETNWQSLSTRHSNAVATMVFKIKHHQTPIYLENLLPHQNINRTHYNLRNQNDIEIQPTRLESFRRSFFPLSARVWNELPLDTRLSRNLDDFKLKLNTGRAERNILYYYGQRWPSIHHARLRIGCSKLNFDLHYNLKVVDSPFCPCGFKFESAEHFFLECQRYLDIRHKLFNVIATYCQVTIDVILFGNSDLSINQNYDIFDAVHSYILESERFI